MWAKNDYLKQMKNWGKGVQNVAEVEYIESDGITTAISKCS